MSIVGKELGKMRKTYITKIFQYSVEKMNIYDAILEWDIVGHVGINDDDFEEQCQHYKALEFDVIDTKCICSHSITNVFFIKNMLNGNILANGCDCIKKTNHTKIIEHVEYINKTKLKISKILDDGKDKNGNLINSNKFTNQLNNLLSVHKYEIEQIFETEKNKLIQFIDKLKNKKITFGKYKNMTYDKIPKSYIRWYGQNKEQKHDAFQNDMMDGLYKLAYSKGITCIQPNINDAFIDE